MKLQAANVRTLLMSVAIMLLAAIITAACETERVVEVEVIKEVPVEKVVTQEVVKTVEVQVPGETVVVEKEVVKTVEVPGQTVVKEVIKEVQVPGETVVVEKEVVKEVVVEKPVEVIREVLKEVEVVKEVVVEAQRPMVRPAPGTVLNIVTSDVGPANWHRPIANFPYNTMSTLLGVSEHLLDVAPDGTLLPMIAREWVVDDVGITWTIQPGVPWHDSAYGTVDVDDIHWSYENGSREGTVSHATGWYRDDFQNPRIVDENTVQWDWGENGPTIRYILTTRGLGSGTAIENKDYYETVGEEVHSSKFMGTGPYKVQSHVNDDIITLEAIKNHWRNTPDFEIVRAIEVPEQATRIALMKGGQGDITDISIPLLDQIVDEPGMRLVQGAVAGKTSAIFFMGGNFQIQPTLSDGTPNAPANTDNPWVGEPGNEEDLERARNLRRALSYAIDRDSINEFILFGQGCHQYVYTIDVCNPRHQDEWIHPYDLDKARELMAMGGFPDGFDMPLWIPTATPPDTFIEVAEAIVPMWEELGVTITIDKSAYSSRRPEFFERGALQDVFAFPWGGNLELVQYTDYLCDLIDGCTLWNSGYDDPIGYDVHKTFSQNYQDTDKAWDALVPYFEYHSHLGDLPVVSSLDWLDPLVVGPRIGEVDMVEHSLVMPEIEGIHIAEQ
ncbi:MAG: ABC transporter substrate-binding protein [Dehalococcoidia bacterium]|nr:ABC transporter substrate-binding protein [Dehalococcoidia bacterium]